MSQPPSSAVDLAVDAWRQGFGALAAMPVLAVSTLGLELAVELAVRWLAGDPVTVMATHLASGTPVSLPPALHAMGLPLLFSTLRGLLTLAILASLLIAVHRFVLLDEVADRPVWRLPWGYDRFVGWLLLVQFALTVAVSLLAGLAGLVAPFLAVIVSLCGSIAIMIVDIRLLILFPAIAVQGSGADAGVAWDRSRGHFWRIVLVSALSGLPLTILGGAFLFVVSSAGGLGFGPGWGVLSAIVYVGFGAVAAALASRFYQIYRGGQVHPGGALR